MLIQRTTVHCESGVLNLFFPHDIEMISECFDIFFCNVFLKLAVDIVFRVSCDRRFHSRITLGRKEM